MVQGTAKIEGLESAMKAMQAAFPENHRQQQRIINGAMGGAARKSFLPVAKQLALKGDGSGALSESLAVRAQKARQRKGKAGGMMVVPVRANRKALARYINFHYTSQGKVPPASVITSGIRHGHLVEFGVPSRGISANAFLWPSTMAVPKYRGLFAKEMMKRIAAAVKRKAKRANK